MGKTAGGAVWLNSDMLNPNDFWQFWRDTSDREVVRYLTMFSSVPPAELQKFSKLQGAELNTIKELLADELTLLTHGAEALNRNKVL